MKVSKAPRAQASLNSARWGVTGSCSLAPKPLRSSASCDKSHLSQLGGGSDLSQLFPVTLRGAEGPAGCWQASSRSPSQEWILGSPGTYFLWGWNLWRPHSLQTQMLRYIFNSFLATDCKAQYSKWNISYLEQTLFHKLFIKHKRRLWAKNIDFIRKSLKMTFSHFLALILANTST
jgi:hypothetical protein